jgi:hypothetical protein
LQGGGGAVVDEQIIRLLDRLERRLEYLETLEMGTGLIDYSAVSTIVGFSSLTVWKIFYKLDKKTLTVWYNFDTGTSNNAALTFTVPYTSRAIALYQANPNRAGTTVWAGGFASIAPSSNVITVYPSIDGAAWPTSGNKQAIGCIVFEVA